MKLFTVPNAMRLISFEVQEYVIENRHRCLEEGTETSIIRTLFIIECITLYFI